MSRAELFAERVKEVVDSYARDGVSLRQLARRSGVSFSAISSWQTGARSQPRDESIDKFCAYTSVPKPWLLGYVDELDVQPVPNPITPNPLVVAETVADYSPEPSPESPLESFERSLAELRTYIGVLESENRRLGGADAVESARRRAQEIISRERRFASRGSRDSKSGEG